MKQGRASSSGPGARKVEPKPHAMNPGWVGQIGISQGGKIDDEAHTSRNSSIALHQGKGYKAPMSGHEVHKTGSQGKHK